MAKVWKYALLNAVRYKKSPKADAVLKKLRAEDFELRKGAKVPLLVMQEEIKSIELLSKEERLEELMAKERKANHAEIGLPELPKAQGDRSCS